MVVKRGEEATCGCDVRLPRLRQSRQRWDRSYEAQPELSVTSAERGKNANDDCNPGARADPAGAGAGPVADAELRMRYEVGIANVGATAITKETHPEV